MFPSETGRRPVVVIVTRTLNCGTRRLWVDELNRLGSEAIIIKPEELMKYVKDRRMMDGVMLDDVFPPETTEMKALALLLTRIRPEPRIAFLVAKHDDYHGLQHLLGSSGRVVIHRDGDPMMEQVYVHLAGRNEYAEPPNMLLH